jgi:hypothetical protein
MPGVIVRNRLGEEIDRVEGVWRLTNAGLRHRHWPHADLSGCRWTVRTVLGAVDQVITAFFNPISRTNSKTK